MAIKLVCVHEYHQYRKGEEVTDAEEIVKLLEDRENHFVRVAVPEPEPVPQAGVNPAAAQAKDPLVKK